MKYDLGKKPTKFAERALKEFAQTLFELLHEKRLEKIIVNELCKRANYPRATFYNYFDDIYDLLGYCWLRVGKDMAVDDFAELDPRETVYILFERCYDYLDAHREGLAHI